MRNITSAFRRALYDGNRNYQCIAYITLLDNTELTITNTRIAQGGVALDDNVSDSSSFTALGSAIINALTLQINNVYEEYSAYDFTGASVVLYISLNGVQESPIKLCTMTVEKASYNGMLITLECLDAMSKFDKPYTSTLVYPATLQSIIADACTECDVLLATTTFPNYTFEISTRPNDEALTYREVVSYVATLAGCFARCNINGALELKWFDKSALIAIENVINGGIFDEDSPYSTGDSVNGGVFNPWNVGDAADGGLFTDRINAHYITALASQELGIEDVVITGIQITVENEVTTEEETRTDVITRTYGTSDYVIKIENNPFITLTNMDTIGAFLQNQLVGLTFRYGTVTHLNDPAIEAGDVAMVWDRKGNAYPLLITNTRFEIGSYQTTTCSADTPAKNSSTRFSALTKSFVQTKNVVKQESNALETRLTTAINSKSGMYETREPVGTTGAYIYYLHDKPNLSESSAVIKITNEAVAVTPNYQQLPEPDWYGLTVDGTFISNLLQATGISFDWARGGTLTLGGANNVSGVLMVKDANGANVGTWNKDGIWAVAGTIGGWSISSTALYRGSATYGSGTSGHAYFGADGISFGGKNMMLRSADTYGAVSFLARNASYGIEIGTFSGSSGRVGIAYHDYTTEQTGSGIEITGSTYIKSDLTVLSWIYSMGNIASDTAVYVGDTDSNHVHIYPRAVDVVGDGSTTEWVQARFSTNNAIYMQVETDGRVSLGSRGNNGTYYTILQRRNNGHIIDAYGTWEFTQHTGSATKYGSAWTSGSITFRRRGSVVTVEGNPTISAISSRTQIATIPAGYRPCCTFYDKTTSGVNIVYNTDGALQIDAKSAGQVWFTTTYVVA